MGSMSNYLETVVSNCALRGTGIANDTWRLYIALFTATPGETGGGTEASFTSYARQKMRTDAQINTDAFTVPDGSGTSTNSQTVTFPTNTGSSQTVTSWGIFDAVTGGNMLFYGALTTSKTVDNGDSLSLPPGSVAITWD